METTNEKVLTLKYLKEKYEAIVGEWNGKESANFLTSLKGRLRNQEWEVKQFCDCYDHDFRRAVVKLAEITDKQIINDSIKTTASMYLKTAQEIDQQRFIRHLKERLYCADCKTPFGSLCEKCSEKE